jgi:hypothetical protein
MAGCNKACAINYSFNAIKVESSFLKEKKLAYFELVM